MNKLRLDLEHLAVDSFTTGEGMDSAGTVRGHGYDTRPSACAYPTPSCQATQTFGEVTCQCLYPRTDPVRICCNTDQWCAPPPQSCVCTSPDACGPGGTV
ncbi:hypothetical protein [Longimicrobium sp.]|uniref:hypothetical protein n=1 Tax=Longimicrobium sp. TaxID=2029185 RepID=UPI002CBA5517|nr:hypothetical protein [Longimicrobium sp.]HSU17622.1 hypothetical protein [Longimicrobium sp.]